MRSSRAASKGPCSAHPSFRVLAITTLSLLTSMGPVACNVASHGDSSNVPQDFSIAATTGSAMPGAARARTITLTADGRGTYSRYAPDAPAAAPEETLSFMVPRDRLLDVWRVVTAKHFTQMRAVYDGSRRDGNFLSVEVTAHGQTHAVQAHNRRVAELQDIAAAIRTAIPSDTLLPDYFGDLP